MEEGAFFSMLYSGTALESFSGTLLYQRLTHMFLAACRWCAHRSEACSPEHFRLRLSALQLVKDGYKRL